MGQNTYHVGGRYTKKEMAARLPGGKSKKANSSPNSKFRKKKKTNKRMPKKKMEEMRDYFNSHGRRRERKPK